MTGSEVMTSATQVAISGRDMVSSSMDEDCSHKPLPELGHEVPLVWVDPHKAMSPPSGAGLSVRVWDDNEVAWALECRSMGDSVADIAQAAGCSVGEVTANIGGEQMTAIQREVVSLYTSGCSFAAIDTARGQTSGRPGSAAAAMITHLRRAGWPIPYRHNWRRFT